MLKPISMRDQEVLEKMFSHVAELDETAFYDDDDAMEIWQRFVTELWPRLQIGSIKFMEEE